ncbi:hypothetical protein Bca52824_054515 [Brassica carinata]|uniref:DUF287 domain-containing protein n=1 Tax=Brassica carinata TaxID=52824 RepID=A0A8X7R7G0_BRACI|nr:hypothetical protein Bca52824_054515 [Brassica carinata]
MKGFPLARVNQELDRIKVSPQDIDSILPTRNDEEKALLAVIHEEDNDDDCPDISVDSWNKHINEGYTVVFEDMYQKDTAARQVSEGSVNAEHAVLEGIAAGEEVAEQKKMLEDVMKKMESLGNQFERVMSIVEKLRKG